MHERWQQLLPRPHGNCLQAPCAGGARDCAHLHLAGSAGAAGAGCHAAAAAAPIAAARHSAACRCRGWHACHVRHARGHPPVDCNLPPPARRRLVTSASPALRRCLEQRQPHHHASPSQPSPHHRCCDRCRRAVAALPLLPPHCCREPACGRAQILGRADLHAAFSSRPAKQPEPRSESSSHARCTDRQHTHVLAHAAPMVPADAAALSTHIGAFNAHPDVLPAMHAQ